MQYVYMNYPYRGKKIQFAQAFSTIFMLLMLAEEPALLGMHEDHENYRE